MKKLRYVLEATGRSARDPRVKLVGAEYPSGSLTCGFARALATL